MGITADEFLEHYGVKGMQWGVRNKKERAADKTLRKKNWREGGGLHKAKVFGSGFIVQQVIGTILVNRGTNPLIALPASYIPGILVGRAVNRRGSKKVSEIETGKRSLKINPDKVSDLEAFINKNS